MIKKSVIRPNIPTQDRWTAGCSIAVVLARATADGMVDLMLLGELEKLCTTEETLSETDITECSML